MINKKNIPNDSGDIQQIKNTLQRCISFKGTLARFHFWECMIIGYLFYSFFSLTEIPHFNIIGWFCYFYIALSSYQKRCRDLNIKGTWLVIGVSVFFITTGIIVSPDITKTDFLFLIFKIIFLIYLGIYLYAQFMPGKKEKNVNLICPLLKYPNVYFASCIVLYFMAYFVVKSYNN